VKRSSYEPEGYDGHADYFAVYRPNADDVYLVADAPSSTMARQYERPETGHTKRANWHEESHIDTVLPDMIQTR